MHELPLVLFSLLAQLSVGAFVTLGIVTLTALPRHSAKVVDRLLKSPQFGERWGRHWLDVVRYAESMGRTRNVPFPFAWRFRDYVIDSFNADKPFNRFLGEQIAGDLLPHNTPAQRDEQIVATGFLALGSMDLNERDAAQFKMDQVDEQIDVTTRAFMAMTVGCARCHDHKFDPVAQEDYYALAGIFTSTRTMETLETIARWNENSIASSEDAARNDAYQQLKAAKKQQIETRLAAAKAGCKSRNSSESICKPLSPCTFCSSSRSRCQSPR